MVHVPFGCSLTHSGTIPEDDTAVGKQLTNRFCQKPSSGFDCRSFHTEQPAAPKLSPSEKGGGALISGPNRFLADQFWTKSVAHKKDKGKPPPMKRRQATGHC